MTQPTEEQKDLAAEILRAFCEAEGGMDNHPFQEAWDEYEKEYGFIRMDTAIYELVYQAVVLGVQMSK